MEITNHTPQQNRQVLLVKGLMKQQALDKIQTLIAQSDATEKELWIDCSHVDRLHLSNSSICGFVSELLKFRKQQVRIVLCDMNATTERLFRLLQLDSLFDKAKSFDEAKLEKPAHIAA